MRHTQTSINNEIIKVANGGGYKHSISFNGLVFNFKRTEDYIQALRRTVAVLEHREIGRDFDVEQALSDSDTQAQFEFDFDTKIENGFSDDVCPSSRD